MICLFERAHEALWIETQYDNVSGEYLVTLRQPDRDVIVERFPNRETLGKTKIQQSVISGSFETDTYAIGSHSEMVAMLPPGFRSRSHRP